MAKHSPQLGGASRQILNQLGVVAANKLGIVAAIFVYSQMMSAGDYGVLTLFQSYLWILLLVLSMNLHVALGRYIYKPSAEVESLLARP